MARLNARHRSVLNLVQRVVMISMFAVVVGGQRPQPTGNETDTNFDTV